MRPSIGSLLRNEEGGEGEGLLYIPAWLVGLEGMVEPDFGGWG